MKIRRNIRRAEGERHVGEQGGEEVSPTSPGCRDEEEMAEIPRAAPPLLGHLVAVDGGGHGRRLAGDFDHDRGRGAAVHGAVIDRRHHDDPGGRGDHRRHGKQDRDPRGGADPRKDADQRSDEAADQRPEKVRPGEGVGESGQQQVPGEEHRSLLLSQGTQRKVSSRSRKHVINDQGGSGAGEQPPGPLASMYQIAPVTYSRWIRHPWRIHERG